MKAIVRSDLVKGQEVNDEGKYDLVTPEMLSMAGEEIEVEPEKNFVMGGVEYENWFFNKKGYGRAVWNWHRSWLIFPEA